MNATESCAFLLGFIGGFWFAILLLIGIVKKIIRIGKIENDGDE